MGNSKLVRFQVLKATGMKMSAFWDVAFCNLVGIELIALRQL
jgi:hypothetical protein